MEIKIDEIELKEYEEKYTELCNAYAIFDLIKKHSAEDLKIKYMEFIVHIDELITYFKYVIKQPQGFFHFDEYNYLENNIKSLEKIQKDSYEHLKILM